MADERKPEEMTEEEIAEANGEPLPDRQAMSLIREPLSQPFVTNPGFTIDPPQPDDV